MPRNVFDHQLELESKGIEKGIQRYRSLREKLNERGLESVTQPGEHLMLDLLDSLTKAIGAEQRQCAAKAGRGRLKKYCTPLLSLPAEKLALITHRQALNSCANIKTSQVTKVINNIANVLRLEVDFEQFKKQFPGEFKSLKRYAKRIDYKAIAIAKKKYGVNTPHWSSETSLHLGGILHKLLLDSTDAFERGKVYLLLNR